MNTCELRDAIARQQIGWTLEAPFYTSSALFEYERRTWLADQWFILGHVSEVREPGAYIVRDLLGESIIVSRDEEGTLRAFYNVCPHRGSRICEKDGHGGNLVCPYHAWTFRLNGSLRSASALPETAEVGKLGLRGISLREIGGLIFGSLNAAPAQLDAMRKAAEPTLNYHGIPEARVAARRSYPTRANWKLVMENFFECYHCYPNHPEVCSVLEALVDNQARKQTPESTAQWLDCMGRWLREEADPHAPALEVIEQQRAQFYNFLIGCAPIGKGFKTASRDGSPIAPLMGKMTKFDGGLRSLVLEPFVHFTCHNDHAVMFQFNPTAPELTDVIITWIVDGAAAESDVDIERMVWLWDVTTKQDQVLIERNAAGVRSLSYRSGPYSLIESWTSQMVARYLKGFSNLCPTEQT